MTTANLIEIFCILDEFCKKKKTLLCSDVFFGCEVCSQKKDIALQRCLLWVPGRTRTVDIQNHNLTL